MGTATDSVSGVDCFQLAKPVSVWPQRDAFHADGLRASSQSGAQPLFVGSIILMDLHSRMQAWNSRMNSEVMWKAN